MARTAMPPASPVDRIQAQVHRAALHAGPAIAALARAGYAAKGVVYVLVGGLAVLAAVGSGGTTTGSRGAMRTVLAGPFGRVMLALIAAGLAGFALSYNEPGAHVYINDAKGEQTTYIVQEDGTLLDYRRRPRRKPATR